MKKTKGLFGIIVPVITPVDNEDRLDEPAFRKVIRYLIGAGVNGIFVGGSAGEGPLLTEREWVRTLETAYDEIGNAAYLLGGVSDTSTKKVVEKIERLKNIGYNNFVVTPGFYMPPKTETEHLRFFGECKESIGSLEMLPYNIPQFTNSEIPITTMCEMAKRGWIRYCKESSGNIDYLRQLITKGGDSGLKVFAGDERFIAEALAMGACGVVAVCSNYEPQTYIKACRAAAKHDYRELWKMQERIILLREKIVFAGDCWVAGIKYLMAYKLGAGTGKPISPLQPLTNEQKKMLADWSLHSRTGS